MLVSSVVFTGLPAVPFWLNTVLIVSLVLPSRSVTVPPGVPASCCWNAYCRPVVPTWSCADAVGPAFLRVSAVAVFIVPISDFANVAFGGSDWVPPIVSTPGSLPIVGRRASHCSARIVIASTNWPTGAAFARAASFVPSTWRYFVNAA